MSDELIALQETASQARAKANELTEALSNTSSDEEVTAAEQAEQAAIEAGDALTDAKAKADAEEADAKAKADAEAAAANQGSESKVTEDASRTGYAERGLRAGDACTCPDGRAGTVHQYDAGLICIPNHVQG